MTQTVSIIAALAKNNRAIGLNNQLLWHISEDLKRFKKLTLGHPIIMGQKTFESIGKALPGRSNIVLTQNTAFTAPTCLIAYSIDDAIKKASELDDKEIFIIGGGQVYTQTIGIADKLYLTLVEGDFKGDVFFPDYSDFKTVLKHERHKNGEYSFEFIDLKR